MKKLYIFSFLLVISVLCAHAEQVTPSEAKQKAAEFLNSTAHANAPRRANSTAKAATLLQVWPATTTANKVKLKAPATNTGADYYIFNTADSTAFVVVSGESTTRSILAYSTEGFFNMDDIAPGAQYLLDGYAEQIEMVKSGEAVAVQTPEAPIVYGTPRVLSTAAWNQNPAPWWNDCPSYNGEKCVGGCVAAAMGIIMQYNNWPAQGVGSNSYVTKTHSISQSANFATDFNWISPNDAMKAKIIHLCGVSVDMDYAPISEGSGASTSNAAKALRKNFKYDIYTREYQRMDYTDAVWKQMLIAEIDANRPMIYSGQTSGGAGHAFVCDGYNADGTFHFNMGWGGSQTGYYSIDGIVDGYNFEQLAVMGITPDKNFDANYTAQLEMATNWHGTAMSDDNRGLKMDTPANIIKGYSFGITAHRLQNVLSSKFNGYVAAALFDATGTMRKSLISSNSEIQGLPSGSAYPTFGITCKVPTDIDMQPTDRIWIMSSTDGNTWYKVYCCSDETSSVAVSGYSKDMIMKSALSLDEGLTPLTGNVKNNVSFSMSPSSWILNYTTEPFSGKIAYALYSSDGKYKGLICTPRNKDIGGNGAGTTFSLTCKVPDSLKIAVSDRIWCVSSLDNGNTWERIYNYNNTTDESISSVPVSGYPGVFFCQGHNGQDAYVYGDVTDDVKSQLAAQADVTRIDLTDATQSSAFDLTGVNPNAYVEGTTAAITGALTKSLTAVSLTDNKPYYADGTHNVSSVTYTRVFNADNAQSTSANTLWQTICLPFDVSRVMFGDKPFDIMDYWLYEVTADGLTRVRTGNIQANKPYVIAFANASQYGELSVSGEVTFTGNGVLQTADTESDVYTTGNYKTVAYYGPTTSNAAYYALDTAGDHFVSGDNVHPFHPYAVVPGETNPVKGRSLNIFDGQTTGIEEISSNTVAGSQMTIVPVSGGVEVTATRAGSVSVVAPNGALLGVFSVGEGTKLIKLPAGLFIVNGKKIMVK